jgi:hypothetical protein
VRAVDGRAAELPLVPSRQVVVQPKDLKRLSHPPLQAQPFPASAMLCYLGLAIAALYGHTPPVALIVDRGCRKANVQVRR